MLFMWHILAKHLLCAWQWYQVVDKVPMLMEMTFLDLFESMVKVQPAKKQYGTGGKVWGLGGGVGGGLSH